MSPGSGWQFWIDRGGTFTDLVGRAPSGELVVRKVLSEQPGQPGDPAVAAMRTLLGVGAGLPLPPGAVEEVRLGTTVATNALLEGQGAPTLLLITRGFADALWIGDQHRPDLFALGIERPAPCIARCWRWRGGWRPMARNWPPYGSMPSWRRRSARPGPAESAAAPSPCCTAAAIPAMSGSWATGCSASTSNRWCSPTGWACAPACCPVPRPPWSRPASPRCWRPTWSGCNGSWGRIAACG